MNWIEGIVGLIISVTSGIIVNFINKKKKDQADAPVSVSTQDQSVVNMASNSTVNYTHQEIIDEKTKMVRLARHDRKKLQEEWDQMERSIANQHEIPDYFELGFKNGMLIDKPKRPDAFEKYPYKVKMTGIPELEEQIKEHGSLNNLVNWATGKQANISWKVEKLEMKLGHLDRGTFENVEAVILPGELPPAVPFKISAIDHPFCMDYVLLRVLEQDTKTNTTIMDNREQKGHRIYIKWIIDFSQQKIQFLLKPIRRGVDDILTILLFSDAQDKRKTLQIMNLDNDAVLNSELSPINHHEKEKNRTLWIRRLNVLKEIENRFDVRFEVPDLPDITLEEIACIHLLEFALKETTCHFIKFPITLSFHWSAINVLLEASEDERRTLEGIDNYIRLWGHEIPIKEYRFMLSKSHIVNKEEVEKQILRKEESIPVRFKAKDRENPISYFARIGKSKK